MRCLLLLLACASFVPQSAFAEAAELTQLRKAANAGDSEAMFDLADALDEGYYEKPNDQQALHWYLKAARKGHVVAATCAGYMYDEGEGVKTDDRRARYWYKAAADKGSVYGQYALALMYRNGEGGEVDNALAAKYYRLAAAQGDPKAINNLATFYDLGVAGPEDNKQARQLYYRAAKFGNATSMYNLGVMYRDADGVQQNAEKQYFWFSLATKRGDVDAPGELVRVAEALSKASKTKLDRAVKKFSDQHFVEE